ncbi:hypothetical protein JYU34_006039 [Plutella xylostella]|uniref:Gustatory receptor n=1 Tax=Plutella xylostella TaxID=51655 RepID=A0ABQ7QUW9_PLUXY|nr:hypothetical protein JYU34_006039 [Plutella xylostella]
MSRNNEVHYLKTNEDVTVEDVFGAARRVLTAVGLHPGVAFAGRRRQYRRAARGAPLLAAPLALALLLALAALRVRHALRAADADDRLSGMNYILELALGMLLNLLIYASAFIHAERYVRVLNTVSAAWTELPFVPNSQITRDIRYNIKRRAFLGLAAVTAAHILLISTEVESQDTVIVNTLSIFGVFIQYLMIVHFYCLIQLAISILQNITENAAHFMNLKKSVLGNNDCWSADWEGKSGTTLSRLEVNYSKAYVAVAEVNACFQLPALASTVQAFHAMVGEAHALYHGVVVDHDVGPQKAIIIFCTVLSQVFKIYLLGHIGSILKDEASKIGPALHDIPTDKQDLRLMLEIQHFSNQIQFEEIELTVYGYFPLDATLLYNIITAAMMYLIIFVQFDSDA